MTDTKPTPPLYSHAFNGRLINGDELKEAKEAIAAASEQLADVSARYETHQAMQRDKAVLVSIVKSGRIINFSFLRNGKMTVIRTYGTFDDDVAGWKAALLSPINEGITDNGPKD